MHGNNELPLSVLINLVTGRSDKKKLKQIDKDSLQMMYITITDKVNSNTQLCKEGVKIIYETLCVDKSEIFEALVDFLEFCAKNTDRRFH